MADIPVTCDEDLDEFEKERRASVAREIVGALTGVMIQNGVTKVSATAEGVEFVIPGPGRAQTVRVKPTDYGVYEVQRGYVMASGTWREIETVMADFYDLASIFEPRLIS